MAHFCLTQKTWVFLPTVSIKACFYNLKTSLLDAKTNVKNIFAREIKGTDQHNDDSNA